MRHRIWTPLFLLPLFLVVACTSNPSAPSQDDGDHDHELSAELTLSSDHVHTLSELTFTVTVTDDHGEVVTDLDNVAVERLSEGSDTWRGTDLSLEGTSWTGTYSFSSSGSYELRVAVLEPGATEPEIIYSAPELLEVARAHVELDGMRVEFETFPGHVHEGETATITFWVMEPERNAEGVRPPMSNLDVTILCTESDGAYEEHVAAETEPGVYTAEHSFVAAEDFVAGVRIGATEAEFEMHVAHGH